MTKVCNIESSRLPPAPPTHGNNKQISHIPKTLNFIKNNLNMTQIIVDINDIHRKNTSCVYFHLAFSYQFRSHQRGQLSQFVTYTIGNIYFISSISNRKHRDIPLVQILSRNQTKITQKHITVMAYSRNESMN